MTLMFFLCFLLLKKTLKKNPFVEEVTELVQLFTSNIIQSLEGHWFWHEGKCQVPSGTPGEKGVDIWHEKPCTPGIWSQHARSTVPQGHGVSTEWLHHRDVESVLSLDAASCILWTDCGCLYWAVFLQIWVEWLDLVSQPKYSSNNRVLFSTYS